MRASSLLTRGLTMGLLIAGLQINANGFDPQSYYQYLIANRGLTANQLAIQSKPAEPYYSGISAGTDGWRCEYLDSVTEKYGLSSDEQSLIRKNGFAVTERVTYTSFGRAFHEIYNKDLPVFITTDAVLYSLHKSYDGILMDIEKETIIPELKTALSGLYHSLPRMAAGYQNNPLMEEPLKDIDIYVTMAISLLNNRLNLPALPQTDTIEVGKLWNAVKAQKMVSMPLFSTKNRNIDFSQFTVRGHYAPVPGYYPNGNPLPLYFRTMMWLGRIDFLLSAPKGESWDPNDLRRMSIGSCLLNELIDFAGVRGQLRKIDSLLTMLVGESDNLTPDLLLEITGRTALPNAAALLKDPDYANFRKTLFSTPGSGQKILSDFFIMDPFATTPDTLPVSFRLMGQRFIIDSYILGNVVYDRIINNGVKVYRMMPDPLDAMYVLGNNNAISLLKPQLDQYQYAPQLSSLRYLVDSYGKDFWDQSLYNSWLQGIRLLKPVEGQHGLPLFMKTAAWNHEKLNTQLASWTQLRHDNLLYAKQSYTGGTLCSFPHSYVEPYPEFYRQIARFASKAEEALGTYASIYTQKYFLNLKGIMNKLDTLSQKELSGTIFSASDCDFLRKMLFVTGGSGAPPFSGWYADLFYNSQCVEDLDYLVADIHTQPTDKPGNVVGRVLHCGTANVNLGVFLAPSPSNEFKPMAFVGPTFTYYEKITDNFIRLTDEEWKTLVQTQQLPARPDWTNCYLADKTGAVIPQGRTLDGIEYKTGTAANRATGGHIAVDLHIKNVSGHLPSITYWLKVPSMIRVDLINQRGQIVKKMANGFSASGSHGVRLDGSGISAGMYLVRLNAGKQVILRKLVLP